MGRLMRYGSIEPGYLAAEILPPELTQWNRVIHPGMSWRFDG